MSIFPSLTTVYASFWLIILPVNSLEKAKVLRFLTLLWFLWGHVPWSLFLNFTVKWVQSNSKQFYKRVLDSCNLCNHPGVDYQITKLFNLTVQRYVGNNGFDKKKFKWLFYCKYISEEKSTDHFRQALKKMSCSGEKGFRCSKIYKPTLKRQNFLS